MNVFIVLKNNDLPARVVARHESELFQAPLRAFELSEKSDCVVHLEVLGRSWVEIKSGRIIRVASTPDTHRSYELDMVHEMIVEAEIIHHERNPSKFPLMAEALQRR